MFGNSFRWFMGMTISTGVCGIRQFMAGLAINFALVAVVQGKSMLAKLGRSPGCRRMAAAAVLAKLAKMNFRFNMTTNTLIRCTCQHGRFMAAKAIDIGMSPLEGKSLLVIEINHTIQTIMASLALCTIKGFMRVGEDRISLAMAVDAINQVDCKIIVQMTVSTSYRHATKSCLVPD
jgi:hypothetical protein